MIIPKSLIYDHHMLMRCLFCSKIMSHFKRICELSSGTQAMDVAEQGPDISQMAGQHGCFLNLNLVVSRWAWLRAYSVINGVKWAPPKNARNKMGFTGFYFTPK